MSDDLLVLAVWWVVIMLNVITWADVIGPWIEKRLPFLVTAWTAIRDTIENTGRAVARWAARVRH